MPRGRRWGVRAGPTAGPDVVDPTVAGTSSVDPTGEGPSSYEDPTGEGPSSYEDTTGRGFEDPLGAGSPSQASFTNDVHDPDTFSPLLWTHHVKHRVSLASVEVHDFYT